MAALLLAGAGMTMILGIVGFLALLVGVLVCLVLLATRGRLRHRRGREAFAATHGFTYEPEPEWQWHARFADMALFNKGRRRRAVDLLSRKDDGAATHLFDYTYEDPDPRRRTAARLTVFALELTEPALPPFSLAPEASFLAILRKLGYTPVPFDDDPEFSRAFTLAGDDHARLRALFDQPLRHLLLKNPRLQVESRPGRFVVYTREPRGAEQLERLLAEGRRLHQAIRERLPGAGS